MNPAPRVICWQCGIEIKKGPVWIIGEARTLVPTFCCREHAVQYDPGVMTLNMLRGMGEWIRNPRHEAETPPPPSDTIPAPKRPTDPL